MMFFRPKKLSARFFAVLSLVFCLAFVSTEIQAQSKKTAKKDTNKKETPKNQTAKKTDKKADKKSDDKKTAKKDAEKNKSAKPLTKAQIKEQEKADKNSKNSKNSKNAKPTKAELARQAEEKRKEAIRQAEIRKIEEARRQAALAEQRRREQAAREARARALAFERGLKTETLDNIAKDNTEGEDPEVRRAAVNALAGHAGTVVVMEPQTGKVLSIVNQDWAIRKGFKPCSTIKLVTATAGLNEKVIDPSNGAIQTRRFPMNLDDALAHSNNSYFQTVGASVGNTKMISYAKALGLGEPTGINADNESPGKLPYGNNGAKIYSHGEDFEVTAVQLAVAVSAISNGGKLVVPQTPKTKIENANFHGYMRREVEVPQNNLQRILPGMLGAVNYGTAVRASDGALNIAGKTGSCIGQGSWLGLFASVAPVVNPRLAVIVITRGSGERGKYASAIAGNIYKSLSHRFNDGRDFTAKVPLELRPQQKVNAKTSATLDNDEGEDAEDGGDVNPAAPKKANPKKGEESTQEVITVGGAKKSEVKTPENKNSAKPATPIFDPVVIQVKREQTRPRIVPDQNN